MVVHSEKGGQSPTFKTNPPLYFNTAPPCLPLKYPLTEQLPGSDVGQTVRQISQTVGFQDRQMTDTQTTHTVR